MSLFDFLPGEGLAIPYILKGVAEALGFEEIFAVLEKASIVIRPNLLERAVEYVEEHTIPGWKYVQSLNHLATPNILRLPLSLTPQLRNFSYLVEVKGFDAKTGELTTKEISISTDELLNKQEAMDIASELAEADTKSGGIQGGSGTVKAITQNSKGLKL